MESSGPTENAQSLSQKCPVCGSSKYTSGFVGPHPMRFKTDGDGWLAVGMSIRARACTGCGHIQFFLEEKLEVSGKFSGQS